LPVLHDLPLEASWIPVVYHPFYFNKFIPRPEARMVADVSGVFDDRPGRLEITSEKELKALGELSHDPNLFIREAARTTIREILSNSNHPFYRQAHVLYPH